MSPKVRRTFRGFQRPNYTMVPDELFDELLADLTGAELKVLLYIIRRTFGFKKDSDTISLSQMMNGITTNDGRVLDHGVGLTKKTVLQALRSLEEQNIILSERRQSEKKGNEPTRYQLNVIGTSPNGHGPLGGKNTPPLGEKSHQGGGAETPPSPRGKNYAPQDTEKQDTERQSSNIRAVSNSNEVRAEEAAAVRDDISAESPSDRDILTAYMQSIALELRDAAPLRSTVTRLLRIYERSNVASIEAFIDVLYQARSIAREHTASVRAGESGSRRLIPYFIAVVEDLVDLRPEDRS